MNFIRLFIYTIIIIAFFACNSATRDNDLSKKPNIILFVSDDHGTDALGCYGNPVIKTPHMDKLAENGIRFSNAFCTSASCAASRSVILTGKYGHATGSYGHVHDYHHFSTFKNVKSLPVLLSDNGYLTARIGKYHLAPESVYRFAQVLEADPRNTVEMANKCEGIIKSDEPFFIYFCPDDPHRGHPFEPDPWHKPNNFGNRKEGYSGVESVLYHPDEVIVPDFLPDTKECREELAEYYQSVSRIDQGLGKLIKLLEKSGKSENTIIIYISDNGIAFPGAKTTLYEPGIRLPCIIKSPFAKQKGIINDAMVTWADLTPTILEMAGINFSPENFHGRSFTPILDKTSPKGWDEIFASHTFHEITMYYPMRVIRNRQFKLIWNIAWCLEYPFASDLWASSTWQGIYRNNIEFYGKRKVNDFLYRSEFELYDLKSDPHETDNLANKKEYEVILKSMKKKIREYQRNTLDPWLIVWDHESSLQGTGVNL
jgi:N-sulfoglucosamine sulfohydrolase